MSEQQRKLAARIRTELPELERLVQRALEGWRCAQQSGNDLYLDSVALNLHGFYSGLEHLFELIATVVDGVLPQGANWHQVLLQQMSGELLSIRPAVISGETQTALDAYRGFRHIVRHAYAFNFDPTKMQPLIQQIPAIFAAAQTELRAFANFLEQNA